MENVICGDGMVIRVQAPLMLYIGMFMLMRLPQEYSYIVYTHNNTKSIFPIGVIINGHSFDAFARSFI